MYNQQSESLTFQQFWILLLNTTKIKVKNAKNVSNKYRKKKSKNQIKLMQFFFLRILLRIWKILKNIKWVQTMEFWILRGGVP